MTTTTFTDPDMAAMVHDPMTHRVDAGEFDFLKQYFKSYADGAKMVDFWATEDVKASELAACSREEIKQLVSNHR